MSRNGLFLGMAAVCIAGVLAACGGSDNDSATASAMIPEPAPGTAQPAPGSPQQASADPFSSRVMAIIGNTSETAEPLEIGTITFTAPEDAEPVPLG